MSVERIGGTGSDGCTCAKQFGGCPFHSQPAPDPAQSAPSAREIENKLLKRLGFSFKAINSSLTVTVFKPVKVMSLSQSDGKWDVVYLMDKAWELLLELMADKEAAALRTAQLERELQEYKAGTFSLGVKLGKVTARAKTAESALARAENLLALYRAKRESDGGSGRVWDSGKHLIAEDAIAKAEAVAAQTPEEK